MFFEIIRPDGTRRIIPLIIHVPHSSDIIPPEYRDQFILSDAELADQHRKMVDHHVDKLFAMARDMGATLFVSRVSRLVMDPERFLNEDQEPMAAHGMGAVYLRTDDGRRLRRPDFSEADRQTVLDTLYHPYHTALNDLVDEYLERFGCCYIIDAHSYPAEPNGFEDPTLARPIYCIGHDEFHQPEAWLQWWREWGAKEQEVCFNEPFAGSLVPNRHYLTDDRVKSMMIEVKRSDYMDEATGEMKDRAIDPACCPIAKFLLYACHNLAVGCNPRTRGEDWPRVSGKAGL